MRLRQLECFVKTCELGSISRAAEQLNVAQPALGLQIRNLEHDFGVTLLVRSSRGVSTTPAGDLMLAWARDLIQRTKEVRVRLREQATADVDVLRLGLSPSATQLLAGDILEGAAKNIPDLGLRIIEGLSHIIVEEVEAERVDLALVTGPFERITLSETPVLQERLYLVSAPGAPAGAIRLVDALSLPLAMPGEGDALRGIVENEAARINVPLSVTYEIGSIPAIKDLAARGMANGILPFGGVRREVQSGALLARPIVDPGVSRTLFFVRLHGRPVGARERRLVMLIRDCMRKLASDDAPDGAFRMLES